MATHKSICRITLAALVLCLFNRSEATLNTQQVKVVGNQKDPLTDFLSDLNNGTAEIKYDLFHKGKTKRKLYTYSAKETKTRYHKVKSGDNLTTLAKRYGTTVNEIMRLNRIDKPNKIFIGQKLIVYKGIVKKKSVPQFAPKKALSKRSSKADFEWPLNGRKKIRKRFRRSNLNPSLGIVIDGRYGDKVKACAGGKVVRVGRMRGYGRYVIVAYPDHLLTVYSRLDDVSVKQGGTVKKGQTIGSLKNRRDNMLHLQVGYYGRPVNPLLFVDRPA